MCIRDSPKSITLEAKDIDDDALFYSAYSDTSGVKISMSSNVLTYELVQDYFGEAEIVAVVNDSSKASDSTIFKLKVENIQDVPKPFFWNTVPMPSSVSSSVIKAFFISPLIMWIF